MATISRIEYRCPACHQNIEPLFRLITAPMVNCPACGTSVRVDPDLLSRNWVRGFYLRGLIALWVVMVFWMAASPDPKLAQQPPATRVIGSVLVGWLPAAVLATPMVVVGLIASWIYARRFERRPRPTLDIVPKGPTVVPRDEDWR